MVRKIFNKAHKPLVLFMVLVMSLQFVGCGSAKVPDSDVDIDLTTMSSTVVYSTVAAMIGTPDEFRGQTVRMEGTSISTHGQTHSCLIYDALGCCAEGIEYELTDGKYPDDEATITIVGTYTTYTMGGKIYFVLVDAVQEK
ncbi:MAG: hypothetical protein K6E79_02495 [Pseudobutyrivibrio sp.]|nr:hypothetical protein [Pseudobutyrivibrio sp.]